MKLIPAAEGESSVLVRWLDIINEYVIEITLIEALGGEVETYWLAGHRVDADGWLVLVLHLWDNDKADITGDALTLRTIDIETLEVQ